MKSKHKTTLLTLILSVVNGFLFLGIWKQKNCLTVESLGNTVQVCNPKMQEGFSYHIAIDRVEND